MQLARTWDDLLASRFVELVFVELVKERVPQAFAACAAQTPPAEPAGEARDSRRPGQRPDAPGHGCMQHLPIDHEVAHHPTHCGSAPPAEGAARRVQGHLVIDLREPKPEQHALEVIQVKRVYDERDCACGHCTRAEPGHLRALATGAGAQ